MHTDYLKPALAATWVVLVGIIGYITGIRSPAGWTVMAALSVIPPVVLMSLWRVPAQSMSESIRQEIRRR